MIDFLIGWGLGWLIDFGLKRIRSNGIRLASYVFIGVVLYVVLVWLGAVLRELAGMPGTGPGAAALPTGMVGALVFLPWNRRKAQRTANEVSDTSMQPESIRKKNVWGVAATTDSREAGTEELRSAADEMTDQEDIDVADPYAVAWDELEKGQPDVSVWARAYAESDGDEKKAKAAYIRLRAGNLKSESDR